ncbi:MAG: 6-bladed beta-propeller [Desulfuromonas sp.]|nr:MAG: 6-bladed beta-propeller [Desulfuromonas sp.]
MRLRCLWQYSLFADMLLVRAVNILFVVAFLSGVLSSCAPSNPRNWLNPAPTKLEWPRPPEQPRIRFLRAIETGGGFSSLESASGRFLSWLTGSEGVRFLFVSPYGVAADGFGKVWVADAGLQTVLSFDFVKHDFSHFNSADGFLFRSPVGLAYDESSAKLYVSDSVLKKVFSFDADGRYLSSIDYPFERPAGLTVDQHGNLYVVDVVKGAVFSFDPSGELLQVFEGGQLPEFRFNLPSNVAVDAEGQVYVVDSMNFRVEVFSPDGRSKGLIGQLGDVAGSFARPRGVAVDSEGHIYVADAAFGNVQIFSSDGTLLLYFGKSGEETGEFSLPAGICIDRDDRIYVVDAFNKRIQIFQYLPDQQ